MANPNMVSAKTAYLMQKWNRRIAKTESVVGKMNTEKKAALAISLENVAARLKVMETTQPGHIGQYKRYALDIVEFAA